MSPSFRGGGEGLSYPRKKRRVSVLAMKWEMSDRVHVCAEQENPIMMNGIRQVFMKSSCSHNLSINRAVTLYLYLSILNNFALQLLA